MFTNFYSIYLNLEWIYGRWLAGIAGSNPARGTDISPLSVVFCQVEVPASG
jgi:hypothetical protein